MDVSLSELRELVLFMGLQRVENDWATELNWTDSRERREPPLNTRESCAGGLWEKGKLFAIPVEGKTIFLFHWSHLQVVTSRGTKEPLDEGERGEWKKLAWTSTFKNLRSWHLFPSLHGKEKGKKWKQLQIFRSKITADSDYSHKIKRCLLFGRKAMTNLDNALKSRDLTLLTKVCIVKAMIFPVAMYGCESCTIKKAEHQRIDAFKMWYWRRLP